MIEDEVLHIRHRGRGVPGANEEAGRAVRWRAKMRARICFILLAREKTEDISIDSEVLTGLGVRRLEVGINMNIERLRSVMFYVISFD